MRPDLPRACFRTAFHLQSPPTTGRFSPRKDQSVQDDIPALDLVRKTALLARLELQPSEAAHLANDFAAILEHFRILAEVDIEAVEPLAAPGEGSTALRSDELRGIATFGSLVEGAPAARDPFYAVPKTIGGER